MPKDARQLENEASNSSAFKRCRKDVSDGTVLREDDSEFQARAAATGLNVADRHSGASVRVSATFKG